jgi:hypothetical protein
MIDFSTNRINGQPWLEAVRLIVFRHCTYELMKKFWKDFLQVLFICLCKLFDILLYLIHLFCNWHDNGIILKPPISFHGGQFALPETLFFNVFWLQVIPSWWPKSAGGYLCTFITRRKGNWLWVQSLNVTCFIFPFLFPSFFWDRLCI